jgi:tRNA nucleotidyltransferase (CCA-adding enzyme)
LVSDSTPSRDPAGSDLLDAAGRARTIADQAAACGVSLDGVWLVGGAVRDALLGFPEGDDLDLAVEGDALVFARDLTAALDQGEVVAEHSFGTATIHAVVDAQPMRIDIASCRTERYAQPGSLPLVELGASIEADLRRRDITANAIAVELRSSSDTSRARLVDVVGGVADIARSRARVLHDASFVDDPTRLFRVARYASRYGFHVDAHTNELAARAVADGALATISAQRLQAELVLILSEAAAGSLERLNEWGVLAQLDPRLASDNEYRELIARIDEACGIDRARNGHAWRLRLAALASALGDDAASWLSWLEFDRSLINAVAEDVHLITTLQQSADVLVAAPNSAWYLALGELRDDSVALGALVASGNDQLLARLVEFHKALRSTQIATRGDDVIAAGVPAGPEVGRLLGDLFLRALDGEFATPDDEQRALVERARKVGGK